MSVREDELLRSGRILSLAQPHSAPGHPSRVERSASDPLHRFQWLTFVRLSASADETFELERMLQASARLETAVQLVVGQALQSEVQA